MKYILKLKQKTLSSFLVVLTLFLTSQQVYDVNAQIMVAGSQPPPPSTFELFIEMILDKAIFVIVFLIVFIPILIYAVLRKKKKHNSSIKLKDVE